MTQADDGTTEAGLAGLYGPAPGQRWIIEAPRRDLADALHGSGLDAAALEADAAPPGATPAGGDARLAFPTFFCARPEPWLAALADLALRGLPFRLIVEEHGPDGRLAARVQLFPRMEEEVLAVLRQFSRPDAEAVEAQSARIEQAFALLRRDALGGTG